MLDFLALAQECAPWVAPQTMAAIVRTESSFNPLSIGVNGGARLVRQPVDKTEAVVTAKWLINKGYNIDLGLGQINSSNLLKFGLSLDDAFDPCKNLATAAKILHGNYQAAKNKVQGEQEALHAALSAYNTGSFSKGFLNGYVQKVIKNFNTEPSAIGKIITPIPLISKQSNKQVSKLRIQPDSKTVKLKIENTDENSRQNSGINVYSTNTQSVMVY